MTAVRTADAMAAAQQVLAATEKRDVAYARIIRFDADTIDEREHEAANEAYTRVCREAAPVLAAFVERAAERETALGNAAADALSWIENFPMSAREDLRRDWVAVADALRDALSAAGPAGEEAT